MTRVTLDADAVRKLRGLSEPAEVCDATGRVVGRFTPAIDLSDWVPVAPDISEEELDRRERSNEKRLTTAEVLDRLKRK